MDTKILAQLDRNDIDLVAAIGALIYTVATVVLAQTTTIDLGAYVVQPQISGPFAAVAFGRWYARRQDAGLDAVTSGTAADPEVLEKNPPESAVEGPSEPDVS